MDALSGRHQTTHGIWLAMAPKVAEPPTLVLDLEGSDGRERGEDDTSFERQSALFALAVADIVLVNMWAKDVGRETGAGKPLLKTIFQVRCGCAGVRVCGQRPLLVHLLHLPTGHAGVAHGIQPAGTCCGAAAERVLPPTKRNKLAGGAGQPQAVPARAQPPPHGAALCLPRPHAHAAVDADRDVGGGPEAHVGCHHQAAPVRVLQLQRLLRGGCSAACAGHSTAAGAGRGWAGWAEKTAWIWRCWNRRWRAFGGSEQHDSGYEPRASQVAYAALPNYEERAEEFSAEAVLLRRKFTEEGAPRCAALGRAGGLGPGQ